MPVTRTLAIGCQSPGPTPNPLSHSSYNPAQLRRGGQILPEEIEPLTAFLTSVSSGRTSLPSQADGGRGQPVPGGVEVEGQAILQRSCQECHDLATATTRSTSEDWEAVIARMMTYGAALTPTDQQELVEYLNGLAQ